MSGNKDIEARLDRSLQNQVRLPQVGKGFDAAVWARIEAEEARATNPGVAVSARAQRASRWLAIINSVGVAATLAVALYFALGSFGGIEPPTVNLAVNVSLPAISDETLTRTLAICGQALGAVALLFGLSFTSLGRRLRASFS
jgi:hypothetical protein